MIQSAHRSLGPICQCRWGSGMTASAVVEERQLLRTLRWWDGFVIALCNPGFLLGSLGFTLGVFGVTGSIILWGISAFIGVLQAIIYSEPAAMFPSSTWTVDDGPVSLGLPHFIAIGVIIAVWLFNVYGIRPFKWLTYVWAACLMIPLFVFIVIPYLTGDWHSSNV